MLTFHIFLSGKCNLLNWPWGSGQDCGSKGGLLHQSLQKKSIHGCYIMVSGTTSRLLGRCFLEDHFEWRTTSNTWVSFVTFQGDLSANVPASLPSDSWSADFKFSPYGMAVNLWMLTSVVRQSNFKKSVAKSWQHIGRRNTAQKRRLGPWTTSTRSQWIRRSLA